MRSIELRYLCKCDNIDAYSVAHGTMKIKVTLVKTITVSQSFLFKARYQHFPGLAVKYWYLARVIAKSTGGIIRVAARGRHGSMLHFYAGP